MKQRTCALITFALLLCFSATAKKKDKPTVPDVVLKAQTVCVEILPDAAEPMADPLANRKAQEAVEKAFMKWGRFRLALTVDTADLVIAVRKGSSKFANPTISGGPVDTRPGTIESTDTQIRIGGQQGRAPAASQSSDATSSDGRAHPGMEVGNPDDIFKVYLGGVQYPLDGASIWSYAAKNALRPPDVTAVDEFRKAIEEAEKAAQKKQQPPPQPQPKTP